MKTAKPVARSQMYHKNGSREDIEIIAKHRKKEGFEGSDLGESAILRYALKEVIRGFKK
jgi:hypothetical protein